MSSNTKAIVPDYRRAQILASDFKLAAYLLLASFIFSVLYIIWLVFGLGFGSVEEITAGATSVAITFSMYVIAFAITLIFQQLFSYSYKHSSTIASAIPSFLIFISGLFFLIAVSLLIIFLVKEVPVEPRKIVLDSGKALVTTPAYSSQDGKQVYPYILSDYGFPIVEFIVSGFLSICLMFLSISIFFRATALFFTCIIPTKPAATG